MNKSIDILIVDDQVLFREALQTLLSAQKDFNIIGQAANGEEGLRLAIQLQPKIVLMDLRMPFMDGVTATRKIRAAAPNIKIIILTTFDDDNLVFDGLKAGAVGYLLKDVAPNKLYEAVFAAARGEYFLQPSITAKVVNELSRLSKNTPSNLVTGLEIPLSPREVEILEIAATGASNKEIADRLVIAEGTVKNHMRNILGKLDARDRMQAVLKARDLGIINL